MELCKEFKSMCINENKERLNESFELDFQENLPQYLDDIEKVVRCSTKSIVTNYEANDTKILIHGKVMISVTYLNKDGCLLSNIFDEEFSKAFDSNCSCINYADIKLITKYCNFRLINQRRIDVHTSLNACISVYCKNTNQYIEKCEKAFIREYSAQGLNNKTSGISSADFDETFTISNTSSQIKNIVNSFAVCYVDDKKIIKDKMLVKLKVELSVIYENDSSGIEKCMHSFSISKIVDVDDCDEMNNAFINADISSIYVKSKSNSSNQLTDIEAVGNVAINYQVFETKELSFVTDSYMPNYTTNLKSERLFLKKSPVYYYDDKSEEIIFDCEKNVIEIIDLKTQIVNTKIEKSEMSISVLLSFLYYDDNSQVCYYEKSQTISFRLTEEEFDGEGVANLLTYDFVIKGTDKIALRISYVYSAYLYQNELLDCITDIDAGDEKQETNMPQLTLYFADSNENVWDIAKKFSTDISLIMEENNLSSHSIENKMVLLVPGM